MKAIGVGLTLLTLGLVSGCKIGQDKVLFSTRTDVAIDIDTSPPAVDIGYAREEFVIAPILEDAKVLPVLTTVGTKTKSLHFNASHSFATGDSALVVADALIDENRYLFRDKGDPSKTALQSTNNMPLPAELQGIMVTEGDWGVIRTSVRPKDRKVYFFGTDTSLGLHVEFDGGTGALNALPTAGSLGYKRKELAYVPLIESKVEGSTDVLLKLPSLLAVAFAGSNADSVSETGIQVGQAYATGAAATLLATHNEIRQAVAPALVGNYPALADAIAVQQAKNLGTFEQRQAPKDDAFNGIMKVFEDRKDLREKMVELIKGVEPFDPGKEATTATFGRILNRCRAQREPPGVDMLGALQGLREKVEKLVEDNPQP